MSKQTDKSLLLVGLFSLLMLSACGNKGPLYQTPPESAVNVETQAGEQDKAQAPQQEK